MPSRSFNYRPKPSRLFGAVRRPLIDLEAYFRVTHRWIVLRDTLADTGADVSILPRHLGATLVEDIHRGHAVAIGGVVPQSTVSVFFHRIRCRLAGKTFSLLVAIADADDVPPILGRIEGLDRFAALFRKGRRVEFGR